jgi:hypothetical protein
VVNTGTDVFFLSDGGLRALSRIIQEKSMPMRDISMNVRDELVGFMTLENMNKVRATHSNKEAFYLLSLPTAGITYCFDLRNQLPNGSHRATSWDGDTPTAYLYKQNEELYMGKTGYIGLYDTYLDNTSPYVMKYYTTYFDFQSPTSLKIMKKVGVTTIGGQGYPVVLKFGYDYTDILGNRQFSVANVSVAEYNISEYNIAEFGGSAFDHKLINIGGAGNVIQLGFETVVNGRPFSIQKLDVYAKIGKTK